MAWTLNRPSLASGQHPTETAPAAAPAPAAELGARSLPLTDSRAAERLLGASIAVREVLDFPLLYLASMPAGWTLSLDQLDGTPLMITSRRDTYEAIKLTGGDVLDARWLWPITLAAEHGRGNRVTLTDWLTRVRQDPSWILTPQYAFAGLPGRFDSQYWPTQRVCWAYGMRLVSVS